ncbi:hypothetical protein HPB50_019596 [Hyalomma asiaticum]|uniref:Uncharacterized protein n=1 Tax=Hyalomma asiaticum TaxID=266040 RepID=A0ACB7TL39_HYAAI|nr:hypothetical protein HPB50_019596 [Hyalomma asiaticum]
MAWAYRVQQKVHTALLIRHLKRKRKRSMRHVRESVLTDFGRYSFGYNVVNGLGARNSRYESGVAYGPVVGSYSLADIDGRARRVDYVADKLGFRAVVRTNEPGTKTSLAAAAPYVSAKGPIVPSAGFGGGYFPFAGGYGGYGGYGGFYG